MLLPEHVCDHGGDAHVCARDVRDRGHVRRSKPRHVGGDGARGGVHDDVHACAHDVHDCDRGRNRKSKIRCVRGDARVYVRS